VVVIHHLPGYDRQTKEFTRSLAVGGHNAVMPNLYHREAPGADPDDAMAAARALGGLPISDDGKTCEFHSYEGAGHAFLQVDRPSYRPEAAVDAWRRIFAWYGKYLTAED
jgi:dienelactone hydrolase